MRAVPYEKFIRLQILTGESFTNIAEVLRSANVPCPSLEELGALRASVLDNLPAAQQKLKTIGFDVIIKGQAETQEYFKSEVATWGKMVRAIGYSSE